MSCARTSAYAQSVELKRRRDNHQSVQRYFIFILLLTAVERAAQGWGQDERDFLPACFERISDNKFALRCCNLDLSATNEYCDEWDCYKCHRVLLQ